MRVEQLRELFGLDASEELYGEYFCAHTKPKWGAQFLHGQLYVFSTLMVFHANLIAVFKTVRMHFKDVKVIRKRNFMRMPNTIAVRWRDETGDWHDEVFTSFVFASRKKAYDTMAQRWQVVNPDAALAYLQCDLSGTCSASHLTDTESEEPNQHQHQHHQPERPFPRPLQELLLPASTAAAAAGGVPEGAEMREVGGQLLPGDAQQLAQVLLSDTSGFLPHAMAKQGNQLVSLTPWQIVPASHPELQPGSLIRTFKYVYSSSSSWGSVRSIVIQQQVLRVFDDGRLLLDITQSMPELPTGVGKAVNVIIRWDVRPVEEISAEAVAAATAAAAAAAAESAATVAARSGSASSQRPSVDVAEVMPSSPGEADDLAADFSSLARRDASGTTQASAAAADSPKVAAAAAAGSVLCLSHQQQQQQQQGGTEQQGGTAAIDQSPFGVLSEIPLDPPSRPGSSSGMSPYSTTLQQQQQQSAAAVLQPSPAPTSSGSSAVMQQLHLSSLPVAACDVAPLQRAWQHGSNASLNSMSSTEGGTSTAAAAAAAAAAGGGGGGGGGGGCSNKGSEHKTHSLPPSSNSSLGSKGQSFIAGLKGSFRELRGHIAKVGSSSSIASINGGCDSITSSNGSNTQNGNHLSLRSCNGTSTATPAAATAAAAAAGMVRSDSPAAASVLRSVHEDPAAEDAAVGGAVACRSSSTSAAAAAAAGTPELRQSPLPPLPRRQQQDRVEGDDAARRSQHSSGRDQAAGTAAAGAGGADSVAASGCNHNPGLVASKLSATSQLDAPIIDVCSNANSNSITPAAAGSSSQPLGSLLGRVSPPASPKPTAATLFGLAGGSPRSNPGGASFGGKNAGAGDDAELLPAGSVTIGGCIPIATQQDANSSSSSRAAAVGAGCDDSPSAAAALHSSSTPQGTAAATRVLPPAAGAAVPAGNISLASGCAGSSSSVEWCVSVGVHWVKWHIAQRKVTDDTLEATAASQKAVMSHGARWMQQPSEHLGLAEVMPQAVRPHGGGRKGHRRSGSAGSAGRLSAGNNRLGHPAATTSRSSLQHRHSAALHSDNQQGQPGTWGVVQVLLGWFAGAAVAAGSVVKAVVSAVAGQRGGLVGLVLLVLLLCHVVLLVKVVQLLTLLVDKLDALGGAAGTCSSSLAS